MTVENVIAHEGKENNFSKEKSSEIFDWSWDWHIVRNRDTKKIIRSEKAAKRGGSVKIKGPFDWGLTESVSCSGGSSRN